MEFTPQRWFYVGLIISATTFIASLGHLLYAYRPTKQPKLYRLR